MDDGGSRPDTSSLDDTGHGDDGGPLPGLDGGSDAGSDASSDGGLDAAIVNDVGSDSGIAPSVVLTTYDGLLPHAATFVAARAGSGPFHVVTGVGGVYDTGITSGPYTVIFVCADTMRPTTTVNVRSALASEATSLRGDCPLHDLTLHDVTGAVSGLSPTNDDFAYICPSDPANAANYATGASFDFMVADGDWDFVLMRQRASDTTVTRAQMRRALPVHADVSIGFDLAALGFDLEQHALNVTNDLGDGLNRRSALLMTTGADCDMGVSAGAFASLPVARLLPTELQVLSVRGDESDGSYRTATHYYRAAADTTIVMPAPATGVSMTTITTTPFVTRTTLPVRSSALYRILVRHVPPPPAFSLHAWDVYVSAGWLGASHTYDLPDPSALAGWDATWTTGPGSFWEVSGIDSNHAPLDALAHPPLARDDGLDVATATVVGGV